MPRYERAVRALDPRLEAIRGAAPARPPKGWIRAIRDALGMTARQLGARLGVSQPRIAALEKAEVDETATLGSLRRAAEALNCRLVYAIVPDEPLATMIRRQAALKADEQLRRVSHTMRLENQGLTPNDEQRQRELLVTELLGGNLNRLWDEPA